MKNHNNPLIFILATLLLISTSCSQSSQLPAQANVPDQTTTTGADVTQAVSSENAAEAKAQVQKVLDDQVACWNEGRLACYMEGYQNSDSLVFVGKNGLTYGWQETLENYKRNYPDTAAMGKLSFDILEKDLLAEDTMLVIGKWFLKREETIGDLQGHFSIILKRFPEGWKIIADHSS